MSSRKRRGHRAKRREFATRRGQHETEPLTRGRIYRDPTGNLFVVRNRLPVAVRERAVDTFRAEGSIQAAADEIGVPAWRARTVLEMEGLLCDDLAGRNQDIRREYAEGFFIEDLEKRYDLSRGRAHQIVYYT
jgi:hypothetical protein